jgi:hypothetical protein
MDKHFALYDVPFDQRPTVPSPPPDFEEEKPTDVDRMPRQWIINYNAVDHGDD